MSEHPEVIKAPELEQTFAEELNSKKPSKSKSTMVVAYPISGIKSGGVVMFRDVKKRVRLVPVEDFQGGGKQSFNENKFKNYDKPVFYNGE
jgi:hypothetical protein